VPISRHRHERREEDEVYLTIEQSSSRSQKPDGHLSPEQVNTKTIRFWSLLSLFPCSHELGRGSLGCSGSVETYARDERLKRLNVETCLAFIS
jgi:hypothetical protein